MSVLVIELVFHEGVELSHCIDVPRGHVFVDDGADEFPHPALIIMFSFYIPYDGAGDILEMVHFFIYREEIERGFLVEFIPEEQDIRLLISAILPGGRDRFADGVQILLLPYQGLDGEAKRLFQGPLYFSRQTLGFLGVRLKNDISGIDVGGDILKAERLKNLSELGHLDFAIPSDIDAPQKRDVLFHVILAGLVG